MPRRSAVTLRLVLAVAVVLVQACAGFPTCCAGRADHVAVPETAPAPTPDEIAFTVYLAGDAGEPGYERTPVLRWLTEAARRSVADSVRTLILFLGDNVYPAGLPDTTDAGARRQAERRLDAQLDAVAASGAEGVFIPGNHDWAREREGGWDAIRRQARYIRARGSVMLPAEGCPGPIARDVAGRVRILFLDTQWWFQEGPKPGVGTDAGTDCISDRRNVFLDSLRLHLADAAERGLDVLVAGHHPPVTGGRHGGYWRVRDHILLPGKTVWAQVGLAAALATAGLATGTPALVGVGAGIQLFGGSINVFGRRWIWKQEQDVTDGRYQVFRDSLRAAMSRNRPLVYAAGHDHNLQLLRGDGPRYVLISGAGSPGRITAVSVIDPTICKVGQPGYARLDFLKRSVGGGAVVRLVVTRTLERPPRELCRVRLD